MQLNLFQWDTLAVGSGYRCLAALDFSGARAHFTMVLRGLPDHAEANRGMGDLEFWQGVLLDLEDKEPQERPDILWAGITGFPFRDSESHRALRRSLLNRLLTMLEGSTFYHPPDLCRGYLHLLLGDFTAAADELRELLAYLPDNGRLHGYLADAFWQGEKQEEAGTAYMTALLLEPATINTAALRNRSLSELIHEHGPAMAPVYGYLAGLLPLLEPPARAGTPEALVYAHLRQAELARFRNDHLAMVTARRDLKHLAPEVLQDYLAWLAAPEKI